MKNSVLLTSVLLSFLMISCGTSTEQEMEVPEKVMEYKLNETVGWLNGIWENAYELSAMRETWSTLNDSTMQGIVTATYNLDTVNLDFFKTDTLETITIEERNGSIFYIPAVKDQNKGLPVKFRLTMSSESELKFENPDHDFPQTIFYQKVNEDSIVASISGLWEGEQMEEKFPSNV